MVIPKIINFIWLGSETYPEKYEKNLDTFRKHNPDFEFKFWYDDDILKLITQLDLQEKWAKIPHLIQKCDLSRAAVMYQTGGIYSDFDFYCYKNLGKLIEGKEIYIVKEPPENTGIKAFNGFIASAPGNKFWLEWFDYAMERVDKGLIKTDQVMNSTGPDSLYRFCKMKNIELYSPCDIIPVVKIRKQFGISRVCKQVPYSETYYEELGNYTDTKWNEGTEWWAYPGIYIFISAIICLILIVLLLFLWKTGSHLSELGSKKIPIQF